MHTGTFIFIIFIIIGLDHASVPKNLKILAKKWAPLVYLAKGEKFQPASVPFFLANTKLENDSVEPLTISNIPKCSPDCFLVTKDPLETSTSTLQFFDGQPLEEAPVYAVVKRNGSTTVLYYWLFSPYNLGKVVCTDFVVDKCPAAEIRLGNHVGDWEHIQVKFENKKPVSIYLAYHNLGAKFFYDGCDFVNSDGEPNIRFYGTHPIIFTAFGSHGSWSSEGIHPYVTLLNNQTLVDECSKGKQWRSWRNLMIDMYDENRSYNSSPLGFLRFQGRWGNKRSGCFILGGLEVCILSSAPFTPSMENDA